MATSNPPTCNGCYKPQLKIVLLGGRNSGKSSVGNLLLGKEEFVTTERTCCSRRLGLVAGRWLTVIDTPGWWCDMSSRDTSRLVNREILNSVTLCSPGPHVFIIVVKAISTFTEQRRRAVEEHVQLLGEDVWTHCFLVLTFKDRWALREAEKHVQRQGQEALLWLYNKCSHRYHSLLVNSEEGATKLMMKIQRMVTANGNTQFEMPEQILQRISDERRRVEERAHHRFKKMKQHRAKMRENLKPMSEIRIVLLGAKGSGKSSVFKTILGKQVTATHHSSTHTTRNHAGEAAVFGREVKIVDTPGWWCNFFSDKTPIFDKRELVLSLPLCPPGPHAFLLVIRIDRAFSDTHKKSVEEHIELISHHIWSRVLVLFTFGDWLGGTTTEQYIESEGEAIQWVLDRCSNRYHVFNNKTAGDGFQVRELIGKIEEMVAGGGSEWYFEIEGSVIRNIKKKMRGEMERAEERRRKKEELREEAKARLECFTPFELQIVLIGGNKTGKSSCGNTILSRNCFVTQTNTSSCIENQGKVNGKTVTVLDTCSSYTVSSELLLASSAFLIVVNISSAFKHVHLKAMEDQLDGVGPQIWSKAMVVFSFGDWLGDTTIEERIEIEGHSLQTLVARCGNRYHVLDNRNRTCTTQVNELIEYTEEIMAEERFQRGDHMTREVSLTQEDVLETMGQMRSNERSTCRNQLSHELADSACAMPTTATGHIVTFSEGRIGQQPRLWDRGALLSCLATFVSVKNRLFWSDVGQVLRLNFPIWSLGNDINTDTQLFSPNAATVLSLPQAQSSMLTSENVSPVHTLCHPMLMDRTFRRLHQYGGLQALIDQWGPTSLEELEDFIDLYFEMVWEQAMHENQAHIESTEEEKLEETGVLSSIDKKLSKLDLLEDIREDLSELRKSLEQSVKAIEELKRQDKDET